MPRKGKKNASRTRKTADKAPKPDEPDATTGTAPGPPPIKPTPQLMINDPLLITSIRRDLNAMAFLVSHPDLDNDGSDDAMLE